MQKGLRGDTLVEVLFAIATFSLVSVISIAAMNSSIETAQSTLEVTMARNEIDAQAEALRFIHNSYLSERELDSSQQTFRNIWQTLTNSTTAGGLANSADNVPSLTYDNCATAYDTSNSNSLYNTYAFVVNTRSISPTDTSFYANETSRLNGIVVAYRNDSSKFANTTLYPRLIFTNKNGTDDSDSSLASSSLSAGQNLRYVARAEGIWVVSIAGTTKNYTVPEYYDFHIRTCWYAPGSSTPSTIGTIIRLYNPELVEETR